MSDLRQAAQMAQEALREALDEFRALAKAHDLEICVTNYEHAVVALTSALEADGWRPIETAPDDGSRILVFDPRLIEAHRVEIRGADGGFWRWNASTGGTNPTHWRPLPPPPRTDAMRRLLIEANARNGELRDALIDATAHLAAATSSYKRFCRKGVTGDALFSTKLSDYEKAEARARAALQGKGRG